METLRLRYRDSDYSDVKTVERVGYGFRCGPLANDYWKIVELTDTGSEETCFARWTLVVAELISVEIEAIGDVDDIELVADDGKYTEDADDDGDGE